MIPLMSLHRDNVQNFLHVMCFLWLNGTVSFITGTTSFVFMCIRTRTPSYDRVRQTT
jgi:hypothetical protein